MHWVLLVDRVSTYKNLCNYPRSSLRNSYNNGHNVGFCWCRNVQHIELFIESVASFVIACFCDCFNSLVYKTSHPHICLLWAVSQLCIFKIVTECKSDSFYFFVSVVIPKLRLFSVRAGFSGIKACVKLCGTFTHLKACKVQFYFYALLIK